MYEGALEPFDCNKNPGEPGPTNPVEVVAI
jgi:hypothetical protein